MAAGAKTDAPPPLGFPPGGSFGEFKWVSGRPQIQGLRARVKRAALGWWVCGGGGGTGGDDSAPGSRRRRRALRGFLWGSKYTVWPEEAALGSLNAEEIAAGPWAWLSRAAPGAVWRSYCLVWPGSSRARERK